MAKTPSTMIPLGTIAPDFTLIDAVTDQPCTLTALKSSIATVIVFMCNHCPYVKLIEPSLVETANAYQAKGIRFIAISANDMAAYPQDGPLHMKDIALAHHYPFPYLFDRDQSVAHAYQAACTPDFYIFDADLRCVYRGRYDDATPGNGIEPTGRDLHAALDAILSGHAVSDQQIPSIGCNIKWKS